MKNIDKIDKMFNKKKNVTLVTLVTLVKDTFAKDTLSAKGSNKKKNIDESNIIQPRPGPLRRDVLHHGKLGRSVHHAPCTMPHAPGTMHHAPCTMHHAPRTTHHAPRTTQHHVS